MSAKIERIVRPHEKPSPVEKVWEHAGLKCRVVFTRESHRCGYVGLPKGRIGYEVDHNDISVSIHGGLTYSCEEDGLWWVGFDCRHSGDLAAGEIGRPEEHFWTLKEVAKETERLAEQLAELKASQTLSMPVKGFLLKTPIEKIQQLQRELKFSEERP